MSGSSGPGTSTQLLLPGGSVRGSGKFGTAAKIGGIVLASLLLAYGVIQYPKIRGAVERLAAGFENRALERIPQPEEPRPALAYITLKLNPYARVRIRNAQGQLLSSFETHYAGNQKILSGEYIFEFSYRAARFEKAVRIRPHSMNVLDVNMYKSTAFHESTGG